MSDLTITAKELLTAAPGLNTTGPFSFPNGRGSYALAKIKRQATGALEDIEKTRIGLCEQFATKDEAGKSVTDAAGYVFGDNRAAFEAAWTAVLTEPVVLSGCRALTVDELDGATMVVTPDPTNPKHVEIIRGLPSDVYLSLGPLVVEPPAPAAS